MGRWQGKGGDLTSAPCRTPEYWQKEDISACSAIPVLFWSSVGSLLEWFEFAVFGCFADIISVMFFPGGDPVAALLKAFFVFAGAFCMRPIGGIVFGYIGDRWGRKRAVLVSMLMMAVATFSLGCLPTHGMIGLLAPLLLIVLRCLQGLSSGGQLVGAFLFTVEAAPRGRRGLFSATCFGIANMGTGLGSAVAALLHTVLSEEALMSWGWRIPFLFSGVAGIFSHIVFQGSVDDTKMGMGTQAGQLGQQLLVAQHSEQGASVTRVEDQASGYCSGEGDEAGMGVWLGVLSLHWRRILLIASVATFWPTAFYIVLVWLATFEKMLMTPPMPQSFAINSGMVLISVILFPAFGMLADRVGPAKSMGSGCALGVLLGAPALALVEAGAYAPSGAILGQGLLVLVICFFGPGLPMWMCEVAPPECRYTVIGVGFNLAQALLGGTAPLVATTVFKLTGTAAWTGIYFSCIALMAGAGLAIHCATKPTAHPAPGTCPGDTAGYRYVGVGFVALIAMVVLVAGGWGG